MLAIANTIGCLMNLTLCKLNKEYVIEEVSLKDEETVSFLFSLGCYKGQPITVISKKKSGLIVAIKEARYLIDNELAEYIIV